jgi:glycosyltransferase involved in cell wall biosynthesis
MLRWMAHAAAVLNTSTSEGQSGAILEAAALGTPVFARSIPGNRALLDLLAGAKGTPLAALDAALGLLPGLRDAEYDAGGEYEMHKCGIVALTPEGLADAVVREILPYAYTRSEPNDIFLPHALRATAVARGGASALASQEAEEWGTILAAHNRV